MEFGTPDLTASVKITGATINDDSITINYDGEIEGFGSVFFTHHLTATSSDGEAGKFEGSARVIFPDGTMSKACLLGIWKREGGVLKIFSLDQWFDEGQFFVAIDVNLKEKTAEIKAKSLA